MTYATFDVAVDGGLLRVGQWGGGGTVLLGAHGITGNHLHFGALADQLVPEFTLVAPDLRGRGCSSQVAGPFSLAAHADDLIAVLDFLDVKQAGIVGHSMGGFVAVVCADRYPDRVHSLTLLDGGIPLQLDAPPGVPIEQLLASVIGPALDRLYRTFDSAADYLDYWRQHPAFIDAWNAHIERAIRYDLGSRPPALRSTVRVDAVIADGQSELNRDEVERALTRLHVPAVLVRAERGVLNQIPPLYPDDAVAFWLDAAPMLSSVVVSAVNHYTILLAESGSEVCATYVREYAGTAR